MRMTSCSLCLVALLLGASVAAAEEATHDALQAVEELHAKIKAGDAVSWDEKYEAYKRARTAIEGNEEAEAAYEAIRPEVADGLRRDSVPLNGWLMGLFGAALLWGGMTVCILIAMRSGKSGTEAD